MSAPVITRDLAQRTLTVRKDFHAALPKVWAAWTTPEKLSRWWGPQEWPATSHRFEFKEGGQWHFSMTGPQSEKVWGLLSYRRIVPLQELHADDYSSDEVGTLDPAQLLSRWEVQFQKVSASVTRLTTRLVCATEERLQHLIDMGFEAGFTSALENLSEDLEGRARPQTVKSADGTALVYEKLGSGPAVILVSGAMVTRDNASHTELAAALSSQFTVYNYDRRGRGDSGDTAPYTVEKEFEDLQTMIDVAGGSASVFAFSSGAILALKAVVWGARVTRLMLWEPPFLVDPADRRPPADALAVVTDLIARGKKSAAVTYFMTKIFGMPAFVPLLMRLSPYWKPSVRVAPTIPYDLAITADGSIPPSVANLCIPTLALHGDHTQPLLSHATEAVAKAIPGAVLKVLPGVNHQVATADLAPAVIAFLQSDPPR